MTQPSNLAWLPERPNSGPRRHQIPWRVVLAVASCLSLCALVYYYFYQRDVGAERRRIVRERATLGGAMADEYATLRANVEGNAVILAGDYRSDHVDPDARSGAFRSRPAVYLRVRRDDARTIEDVHRAGKQSSIDGLFSCLMHVQGGTGPWSYGEVVARAEMLGSEYLKDVRETTNDLRLRNLAYALEVYKEKDYPFALAAVKQAEYAVIAIDEDPSAIPEHSAAFGEQATIAQRIASVPHPVRLGVYRLADGRAILRVRRTPDVSLLQVQGEPTAVAAALEVRRGQALSCAMANEALGALDITAAPAMRATPPPLPATLEPTPAPPPSPSASSLGLPAVVPADR